MKLTILNRSILSILALSIMTAPALAAAWQFSTIDDNSGRVGWYTSIGLDTGGSPRISYQDVANSDLKYAWKDDAGWHSEIVDAAGNVGLWTSLAINAADEPVVHKRFNSSFEQTSLEAELACAGATHIVLAGAATNWCVRATAYGALDRGYDLTLVSDAHTTASIALADGKTIEAAGIVRELNIAMTWLSYPGRTTAAATTDETRDETTD